MRFAFPRRSALALTGVILALILAIPPLEADPATPAQRTLTVSGEGEARAVPDQAQLSAGVVTTARTAAAALAANTKAMNGVFATLKKIGVPDKSMQTSNFSVMPQYPNDNSADNSRRIVGYQVSNTVNVTLDDLGKLGPALDALVSSGANNIGDIGFSIRNPAPLMMQARAAAVRDAVARAQAYAKAAGVSLGSIVSIQEGSYSPPRPMFRAMAMAAAPAPVPVAAGEQTVTAEVTIVWEIR